jgi:hypothetical protein
MLFAHLTPDDRNHIRQQRKQLGATGENRWSPALLKVLARRKPQTRSNGGAPPREQPVFENTPARPVVTGSMTEVKQILEESEEASASTSSALEAASPPGEPLPEDTVLPDEVPAGSEPAAPPERGGGGIGIFPPAPTWTEEPVQPTPGSPGPEIPVIAP